MRRSVSPLPQGSIAAREALLLLENGPDEFLKFR
jgi:hypothetical protein